MKDNQPCNPRKFVENQVNNKESSNMELAPIIELITQFPLTKCLWLPLSLNINCASKIRRTDRIMNTSGMELAPTIQPLTAIRGIVYSI